MNLDYKFTDTDVRAHPQLTNAVYDFLSTYEGEFAFLVEARKTLSSLKFLHIATVRGVLNCMRIDPRGQKLLSAYREEQEPLQVAAPYFVQSRPRVPRSVIAVPMRTTFKAEYVLSTHKQAYKAHLLDPQASSILWYPGPQELLVVIRPYCSSHLAKAVLSTENYGRDVCFRCIAEKEKKEKKSESPYVAQCLPRR